MNPFKLSFDNKRYHTLNYFYQNKFNQRVSKISLDANFTCPNIDGKTGFGGCIYCKQSNTDDDLLLQFEKQKKIIDHKWPNSKYIGFFQSNTNTYAPLHVLKEKYELTLKQPNIIGLNISTRPDSISEEVLDYLEELNNRTYLTIELGLQTIHESTAKLINRCHSLDCFKDMVHELRKRKINIVVHIINGLPYETKEMMLETIKYLSKLDIQGIKIHMLHVVYDTPLEKLYNKKKFHLLTKKEYVDIVCDQLELLPSKVVVHRLTGDPVKEDLIAPQWVLKKVSVLNDIDKELSKRNTYQEFNRSILNRVKQLLVDNLNEKDIVVDATIGNGNDTLFLANIVNKGHVYGFDIQDQAIKNTKLLLTNNKKYNYTLFKTSHDNILKKLSSHKNKISAVIFNLGYLPNGQKEITTKHTSTIKAIKDSLLLLNNKGICLIVIYPGHEEGLKEEQVINNYVQTIMYDYDINYYYNTDNKKAPYLLSIKNNKTLLP